LGSVLRCTRTFTSGATRLDEGSAGASIIGSTLTYQTSGENLDLIRIIIIASDDQGVEESQGFFNNIVEPVAITYTPLIDSAPPTNASIDIALEYRLSSTTMPPGETADFELLSGPAGMTLDIDTLNWTPSPAQVGSHTVVIALNGDPSGTTYHSQEFSIQVSALIVSSLPDIPQPIAPADNSIVTLRAPIISWQPAANADSYDLFLWLVGDSAPSFPSSSGIIATSLALGNLAWSGNYHWQLQTVNSDGVVRGPIQSFTVFDPPQFALAYDPATLTNQDVTATISLRDGAVTSPSDTHIFTQNDSHTFSYVDENGVADSATATVTWIDKTPPTATIAYSDTAPSQGPVAATLTPSDGPEQTHEFALNGTLTFHFSDAAVNSSSAVATVTNIDVTPPTAQVTYAPATLTNTDVIATLTPSEGPIQTHTFTANATHVFTFADALGNADSATATVTWIDKTPPTATIAYSDTAPTQGPVTATLTPSDGPEQTHDFPTNGTHTFHFSDTAGNSSSAVATVTNIDLTPPTAQITYAPSTLTNSNVIATLTPSEGAIQTHSFTANATHVFTFADALGNAESATATVTWIDKTPPTATIAYSDIAPTQGPVTATLTQSDGPEKTHEFALNGTHTFHFSDAAGNSSFAVATVSNIDLTPPAAEITYAPSTLTNTDVIATLTPSDGPIQTHTFIINATHVFTFADALGNADSATATVTWIDKTPPTATIAYSDTAPTQGPVTATLTPSDGSEQTHEFATNSSHTFHFSDAAGNSSTAVATVTNIDLPPPTATITYSDTEPTQGPVTATLIPSDGPQQTHEFPSNGSHSFNFSDAAGNSSSAVATVTNIDVTPPTAQVTYAPATLTNTDVVATLTPSEGPIQTHSFTANATQVFTFADALGNADSATATVTWIDKTPPTASIAYSETAATLGPVTATLTPSDGPQQTHDFTSNGSFTFHFSDEAGNSSSAVATITNIDLTPPTAQITYDPSTLTNTNVLATLTPSEGAIKTHTFTINATHSFTYADALGNADSATATVTWIDKTPPTATIAYSETAPTQGPVTATLTPSDSPVQTHEFSLNGSHSFHFSDAAGNSSSAVATVTNIDVTPPTAQVTYAPATLTNTDATNGPSHLRPSHTHQHRRHRDTHPQRRRDPNSQLRRERNPQLHLRRRPRKCGLRNRDSHLDRQDPTNRHHFLFGHHAHP
jgi:hypothetical protein